MIPKPKEGEYPAYYQNYYKWVNFDQDLIETWKYSIQDGLEFWNSITEEQSQIRYEEGKWSIKEMLLHLCDSERIFLFRALCFSRGEQGQLKGFDHNSYVDYSAADERDWASILMEYQHVKQASFDFINSLSAKQWQAIGQVEDQKVSVAALAHVMPGHDRHHQEIVKSRYLA